MYSIKGPISLFVQHIVSMYIHAQSCCIENRAIGLGVVGEDWQMGGFKITALSRAIQSVLTQLISRIVVTSMRHENWPTYACISVYSWCCHIRTSGYSQTFPTNTFPRIQNSQCFIWSIVVFFTVWKLDLFVKCTIAAKRKIWTCASNWYTPVDEWCKHPWTSLKALNNWRQKMQAAEKCRPIFSVFAARIIQYRLTCSETSVP